MNEKVEDLRWLIAHRADQIWSEGIKTDPLLRFDRVKVALENMIENTCMIKNMWSKENVKGLSIGFVDNLLKATKTDEILHEIYKGEI